MATDANANIPTPKTLRARARRSKFEALGITGDTPPRKQFHSFQPEFPNSDSISGIRVKKIKFEKVQDERKKKVPIITISVGSRTCFEHRLQKLKVGDPVPDDWMKNIQSG